MTTNQSANGSSDPLTIGTEEVTTRVRRPVTEGVRVGDDDSDPLGIGDLLEGLKDGDHKLYVWRRELGKVGKHSYVGNMSPEEFSIEAIQEAFGGGDYKIQGRKANRYVAGASASFRIEGPSRPLSTDDDGDPVREAGIMAAGAITVADLVAILADARRPHPEASHGNPIEMAVSLVTAMQSATAPLLAAVLDQRSQGPDMESILAVFEKGLEIGSKAGGSDDGYTSVIQQFLPAINRLTGAVSAPAPNPTGASPGTLPTPPGDGPAALPAPPPVPGWVTAVSPYLEALRPMAAGNAPPELYAAVALDQATDDVLAFLAEQFARGDDFREDFYRYFPWAVEHRLWWDDFLGAVAEGIEAPEPDPVPVAVEVSSVEASENG